MKQLEHAGAFSRDQAETLAESIHAVVYEDLATQSALKAAETAIRGDISAMEKAIRTDMVAMEKALRSDMTVMENAIKGDMAVMEKAIRGDMAVIRSDMKGLEYALKLWMGSVAVGMIAVLGGLMTLFRFIH